MKFKVGRRVIVLSTINPNAYPEGSIQTIAGVDGDGCYLIGGGYGIFRRFRIIESDVVKEILSHYDID